MLSWCNLEWHHMHASCRWSQGQWIVLWNSQNRQSLLWNQWAVSGSGYTTWFSHPESCQLRKEFPLACVQDTGNMSPRFGLFLPSVSLIVFVIQTNMVSPKQETLTVCVYGSRSGDNWLWIEKQANHPSLSFPDSSDDKESACNAGDLGSVPGSQRSPGGGHGYSVHYSSLENPTDEESGRLQSIRSQRAGDDWSNLARTHTRTHPSFGNKREPWEDSVLACCSLHSVATLDQLMMWTEMERWRDFCRQ